MRAMIEQKTICKENRFIPKSAFMKEFLTNKYMYMMTLPGILFFIIFSYLPMIGVIIAFQDYNPIHGFRSKLIGFKNFEFFFTSNDWLKVTFNTLYLNVLFIGTGIIFSIAIAIALSEIKNKMFVKINQSVVILPHFLSWAVVAMFSMGFFSTDNGFLNSLFMQLGIPTHNYNNEAGLWPPILIFIRLWKEGGFGSIIYLASISGIDQEIYEASKIDGANRLQNIFYITIPLLKTTIILLTLLKLGNIFYGDFGMIYALVGDNAILYPTTDVIDTFVFRSLRQAGSFGMAAAVGLYQSVVGFIIVIISNTITKKINEDAAIF